MKFIINDYELNGFMFKMFHYYPQLLAISSTDKNFLEKWLDWTEAHSELCQISKMDQF